MKEHYNLLAKNKQLLPMEYIRTPKEIWEDLSQEFDFTVDACASDKNHLVDRYWTKEQDALLQDWDHETIYCHPMYDRYIPKFVKKASESQCLCVFLLPASTNSVYFHQYFWNAKEHKPRDNVQLRFLEKPKGPYGYRFNTDDDIAPKTGYLRPLMVVVINNLKRTNVTK